MPDRPHLHELPKHIHGEFKTMARRQEAIQRRIDQLEKLKQKDIDVKARPSLHASLRNKALHPPTACCLG